MTPEAQRKAIQQVCGWVPDHISVNAAYYVPEIDAHVGDPLRDLNAMREARTVLCPALKGEYARILKALTWQSDQPEYCAMDATAAQEAEAFLRALNLWQE